jgi:hypothetical protein
MVQPLHKYRRIVATLAHAPNGTLPPTPAPPIHRTPRAALARLEWFVGGFLGFPTPPATPAPGSTKRVRPSQILFGLTKDFDGCRR